MDAILKASLPKLREKLLEALQAVLPIVAIVLVLCFTIAPVSPSILLCFLLGAVLIVVGIMFFTLGAEMSMTPMGERVGAVLTRSRKLPMILGVGFLLGFLITISEPDLQVLANQVPSIPNQTLIFSVAAGLAYTYVGLVLFLTGANVGFMPAGNYLGQVLAGCGMPWVIIPIGMLIGYFIVKAEPAVYVLNKQVEEVTDGAISAQAMGMALSAGVSISVGLAMVRVLTGISILWFLIPGYAVAIGISFVVPKLFTAIAFDAGGVASGPMTATFLLPLAQGACVAVGGNIVTDAFGVVAMVAMTPLITVQLMGLAAQLKTGRRRAARAAEPALAGVAAYADWPDDDIIEL